MILINANERKYFSAKKNYDNKNKKKINAKFNETKKSSCFLLLKKEKKI